jgi:hypothetical protein
MNLRKTHRALRQRGHQSSVGKVRNAARWRRDALGRPKVQRFPQRALYRRRIERIAELLTAAPPVPHPLGASVSDTVLVAGDQIAARYRMVRQVWL